MKCPFIWSILSISVWILLMYLTVRLLCRVKWIVLFHVDGTHLIVWRPDLNWNFILPGFQVCCTSDWTPSWLCRTLNLLAHPVCLENWKSNCLSQLFIIHLHVYICFHFSGKYWVMHINPKSKSSTYLRFFHDF